jgi:hypothetical protein
MNVTMAASKKQDLGGWVLQDQGGSKASMGNSLLGPPSGYGERGNLVDCQMMKQ